jgi:hypothetical protein
LLFGEYNRNDQFKEDKSVNGGEEECIEVIVGKARRKETTRMPKV